MSEFNIKEARNAAGMSQKELAAAVPGVSVSDISKAERGLKELTPEQIRAIEAATAVAPESLQDAAADVPASNEKETLPVTEAEKVPETQITVLLTAAEKELLDLYKASDPVTQKLILCVLKREKPKMQDLMPLVGMIMSKLPKNGENPLAGVMNSLGENGVNAAPGMISGLMALISSFKGMKDTGEKPNDKPVSGSLLTFTYLYSSTLFILLLSFYFWLWRKDIKPEKPVSSDAEENSPQ